MDKIANAIKDYPKMQIDLDTESDSKQLISLLKNNKIDFAILDVIPVFNIFADSLAENEIEIAYNIVGKKLNQ